MNALEQFQGHAKRTTVLAIRVKNKWEGVAESLESGSMPESRARILAWRKLLPLGAVAIILSQKELLFTRDRSKNEVEERTDFSAGEQHVNLEFWANAELVSESSTCSDGNQ